MADFTFGPFVLSTGALRLHRDATEIPIRPQAFHALRVLLTHPGAPVDYDTMLREAWRGTHVSRHTVEVTLGEIRQLLGEYGSWVVHLGRCSYVLRVPESDRLVRQGWHFWSQRTRTGCEQAIECFQQASVDCPSDFRAFEGLSASYLALAIFGMRCPRTVYSRFLEAHQRAAALTGLLPELRSNHAFGRYVFEHCPYESETELLRTVSEKPTIGSPYVRLALLYGSFGNFDEALKILGRGQQVDPLLPTMAAAEVLVHCWRRDFARAVAAGRIGVELHPFLHVVRANYAQALQLAGRPEDALIQYRLASTITADTPWLRALEGACLATLGRRHEANIVLEQLEAARRVEYVDAYHMAIFRSALGQPRQALAELDRAYGENSAPLYQVDVDPMLDTLRAEPGFRSLRGRRRAS